MRKLHAVVPLFLLLVCIVLIPVAALQTAEGSFEGSITRGSRFTVTIIGLPYTGYYVWIPHTSTMTGLPHDQPPVIAGSQSDLRQDPPDGPYVIESYRYSGGGGDTIRDDIPPSTPDMPNTRYYGLVTTDSSGQATVEFLTSFNTALRSYSVKVENPRSADTGNLLVQIHTYSRTVPPTVVTTAEVTTNPVTTVSTTTSVTTLPETTTPVPVPTTSASPAQTTAPKVPLAAGTGLAALAALMVIRRK